MRSETAPALPAESTDPTPVGPTAPAHPIRCIVGGVLLALVAWLFSAAAPAAAQEIREIHFPVPVESVGSYRDGGVYWTDTYGAPRGGGRTHLGVDMCGPKMTPLLAVRDATITWMRSDGRGNNLELTDAEGWTYHYIHINNDTPGTDDGANLLEHAFSPRIAEAYANGTWRGLEVREGELVAYLGDSGNAENTCAHLHFEIARPDGSNINPTASVDAAYERAVNDPQGTYDVDPALLGPYDEFHAFQDDLYSTLAGRDATNTELAILASTIEGEGLAAAIGPFVDVDSTAGDIDRLYVSYFNRRPDHEGYTFWLRRLEQGWTLQRASAFFSDSDEYRSLYGDADFGALIDTIYREVLGREPDVAGRDWWLAALENDPAITRVSIIAYFADSPELRDATGTRSEFVALTALFRDRMPTDGEVADWIELRRTTSLADAIDTVFVD